MQITVKTPAIIGTDLKNQSDVVLRQRAHLRELKSYQATMC